MNYDPFTDTILDLDIFEARSTQPLVSAGGNLLEVYGEGVEEGVGEGEGRIGTVLAEPSGSDLLMLGSYDFFTDPFFAEYFGFVDLLVKDSPDARASRLASDVEGRWYQTVLGRNINRQNVSTNVAIGSMRVIDFEPAGVCTFAEAAILPEPEIVSNGDFYLLVQLAYAGGMNLTDRGVFANVTVRTRSACTYTIDGNGNLSVNYTSTDNSQMPPVDTAGDMTLVVSDDNNYFVPAPGPDGVESDPNLLVVGYRAPDAISVDALDGDYLFYLNIAEYTATGLAHTAQTTGQQLQDLFGRGRIKFDSANAGTAPAGQGGAWYACEIEIVMNGAEYQANGQPSLAEVTTDMQLFEGSQTLDCDYSLSADGSLLMNVIVSDPGNPVEEVLFAGYVSANGEVLSLIDYSAEIENPESQIGTLSDKGSIRHILGMKYTGDLSGNVDGDLLTNLEEFQFPLPPVPSTVFGDVTTLTDLTMDGIPELAAFGEETFDRPFVNIYTGDSGALFNSIEFLNDKWQGIKLATVRDADQNGIEEDPAVAMLAVNKTTDKIRVAVVSAATGTQYYSIQFLTRQSSRSSDPSTRNAPLVVPSRIVMLPSDMVFPLLSVCPRVFPLAKVPPDGRFPQAPWTGHQIPSVS